MIIIGAGMAGCIAGIMNPKAIILEGDKDVPDNHRAVLRFRNDEVSRITGIPFKKVKVHKAIWYEGDTVSPSPRYANLYSQKVIGKILDRSIWNLKESVRYVAPSDFHQQMADMLGARILYNQPVVSILDKEAVITAPVGEDEKNNYQTKGGIISTIPMPVLGKILRLDIKEPFKYAGISTIRFSVPSCETYCTIYFPSPTTPVYRATLTGSELIVEAVDDWEPTWNHMLEVCHAFGLSTDVIEGYEEGEVGSKHNQRYGKIAPINDMQRRSFITTATIDHGVYSLGRFATWRNILLDDVVGDVYMIRKLLNCDLYDHRKEQ